MVVDRRAPRWRLARRALATTRADVSTDRRRQRRNRWSNAFDIGHGGNSALWSVHARSRDFASRIVEPSVEPGSNPQHGLTVDLTHPRLADFEDLADLAQIQLLVVVEGQHEALALR